MQIALFLYREEAEMHSTRTLSRGVIVVDETLASLAPFLRTRNIRVIVIPSGTGNETIKTVFLPHRILVTNQPERFQDDVSSFEYGLISMKGIKDDPKALAKRISNEIVRRNLWPQKHGFILTLLDGTFQEVS